MMKKVGMKKGDTLVEVMLAVGIFCMVAIAVVSVISGSTSSAQTALEATLAREEIDAQAEAIRFIHDSYLAGAKNRNNQNENNIYEGLWGDIVGKAVSNKGEIQSITESYPPTSCEELYSSLNQKAFVINTHLLGSSDEVDDIYVSAGGIIPFRQASTYPRLVYGNGSLASEGSGDLEGVEGIYVIAVKDPESTNLVSGSGSAGSASAYYDFYIRTCWYGMGDREASTISTVIRLYDPEVTKDLGQ